MANNTHCIDLESTSSQYLSAADSASLSLTQDLTFECWLKLESSPSSGNSFGLCSKWDTSPSNKKSWIIQYENNAGVYSIRMYVSSDGSTETSGSVTYTLTPGTWYHLGVVYKSSLGQAEVFIDFTSVGTITGLATSIFDTATGVYLGLDLVSGTGYFDGLMDTVRLWSTTKTAAQLEANANQEIGSTTGLVGEWLLNNALTDNSGNSNTLTNNGAAVFSTASLPPINLAIPTAVITANAIVPSNDVSQTLAIPTATVTVSVPTLTASQVDKNITNLTKNTSSWTNKAKS